MTRTAEQQVTEKIGNLKLKNKSLFRKTVVFEFVCSAFNLRVRPFLKSFQTQRRRARTLLVRVILLQRHETRHGRMKFFRESYEQRTIAVHGCSFSSFESR